MIWGKTGGRWRGSTPEIDTVPTGYLETSRGQVVSSAARERHVPPDGHGERTVHSAVSPWKRRPVTLAVAMPLSKVTLRGLAAAVSPSACSEDQSPHHFSQGTVPILQEHYDNKCHEPTDFDCPTSDDASQQPAAASAQQLGGLVSDIVQRLLPNGSAPKIEPAPPASAPGSDDPTPATAVCNGKRSAGHPMAVRASPQRLSRAPDNGYPRDPAPVSSVPGWTVRAALALKQVSKRRYFFL
ncbi:hypothetical protein FJT64_015441 [Amphibalanus amphitrite]|uniref:Uncharacterized protein n=1 Tax=Amphibalanus amphitrite TaxID=1232801 RepID=A0A6A4XCL3_AMPAM|nr:hypothetical protein FJT64_015441 [Amphibalanus amphitrite]